MNNHHAIIILAFVLCTAQLLFNSIETKTISDDPIDDNAFCKACRRITSDLLRRRRDGASRDEMYNILKKICVDNMLTGEENCEGIIQHELDIVLYIIDNRKDLTGARICAIYQQHKMCEDPNMANWTVAIPPKNHTITKHTPRDQTKKTYLRLLHLSDMHYDVKYKPGSDAKCSKALCCRDGDPTRPENAAGHWGSYETCDLPWHTVEMILNHIKKTHNDLDFVYYTGDIVGHTSYEMTIDSNTEDITRLYRAMSKTFGSTPVYPVLGNHETDPSDFYAPVNVTDKFSSQWLFDLAVREWSKWFPTDQETGSTLRNGGFYTLLLRPGHRLVALNNNVGYISNLWLIYNDIDPYDQLKWLVDTLHRAEIDGERVHIIGHMEPGESLLLKRWTHEYQRVLRRFADTISAQINGHSHLDEFRLIYDEDKKNVVHYSFVGGSGTTFIGNNPNYRIYNVDPETFKIVDYVQYTFNLTEANMSPMEVLPKWYEQYTFLKEYNLNEINEDTMQKLFDDLSTNETLAMKYFKNHVRYGDSVLKRGCDSKCLKKVLCRIDSIEFVDAIKCI